MKYRTKTYIAGDWDSDKDAVDQLHKWNDSNHWSLSFHDAHEVTKARDSSLACSIKASLKKRMDVSKTFVLIVGEKTNSVTKGSCQHCSNYNGLICTTGHTVDTRSFVKYECDKAVEAGIKVVILYKSEAHKIDKTKCPVSVRDKGSYAAMYCRNGNGDYNAVKEVLT